jgi:DNA-binding NtrC family response regulator
MGHALVAEYTTGASNALIASPNADFRKRILNTLRLVRCSAEEVGGGAEALAKLEQGSWRSLVLDRWLPDLDVPELLSIVKQRHPQVEVAVVDSDTGTTLTESSAVDSPSLRHVIQMLGQTPETYAEDTTAEDEIYAGRPVEVRRQQIEPLPGMIGCGNAMQQVYRLASLVAPRSTTVLVMGETGTGKELVARAIHLLSKRSKQPFITVNCAAIPEALLEAELFGYARGAFTGAFQSRLGRIHAAHGGTLFLDEVGDLPLSMQAKLLRFLQEGEVQRLGGTDIVRVDVRVIAATNAELARRVKEHAFREDLYYRIAAFPIHLTPLRKRPEDVPLLAESFLADLCQEAQAPSKSISLEARTALCEYAWPGNVRELRHVIERAFILSEDLPAIQERHLVLPGPIEEI